MNQRNAKIYAHNLAWHVLDDYVRHGCFDSRYDEAHVPEADKAKVLTQLELLITRHAKLGGTPNR